MAPGASSERTAGGSSEATALGARVPWYRLLARPGAGADAASACKTAWPELRYTLAMAHKTAVVLRASDIDRGEVALEQRLNPRSRFSDAALSSLAGFERIGLSRGRIPPGGESFAYHAHEVEEEWIFIVSGRARARIGGRDHELGPGDFAGFPAPQAPHLLSNPFEHDCVYLMGGERGLVADVLSYPDLDKRYVLVREPTRTAFHALGPAEYPFGRAGQVGAEPPAWRVLGCRCCGSVIAEAALILCGIRYDREEVDYSVPGPARDRLLALNPLGQVPTVVMPDGAVMTETAAIALHLDELVPAAGLLPAPRDPLRREALRWLAFLIGAVYPTFSYGDEPAKWVGDAGPALREATDMHRQKLWRQLEAAVRGPWLLGPRFSILDVYIAAMTRWRPGRSWFTDACPKLAAIAAAADTDPRLAALWAANL
jgi:GST-like protein